MLSVVLVNEARCEVFALHHSAFPLCPCRVTNPVNVCRQSLRQVRSIKMYSLLCPVNINGGSHTRFDDLMEEKSTAIFFGREYMQLGVL